MEVRERESREPPWTETGWNSGFGSLFLPPHAGPAKTVGSRYVLLTPWERWARNSHCGLKANLRKTVMRKSP